MRTRNKAYAAVLTATLLFSATAVQAAENTPENMTCAEFINLNPKAMAPIAFWMLQDKTVYRGGDTVDLNETTTVGVPQLIEFCKQQPQEKVYAFKNKLHDLVVTSN